MEIATLARASLPILARSLTQGPTPALVPRVMITCAPAALSSASSRVPTSNVNAASEYPALVEVPVVSQALVPVPIGTCWLMISGCAPLPPLCPGSTTIVLPATAARLSAPLAVGTLGDAAADCEDATGDGLGASEDGSSSAGAEAESAGA